MKAGGFACLASLMRPPDLLLPGVSPELAVAASAADSAIDHLSPQEEVRICDCSAFLQSSHEVVRDSAPDPCKPNGSKRLKLRGSAAFLVTG